MHAFFVNALLVDPQAIGFLRSGKNRCEIRAKHKNFGKTLICPEKNFVSLRKLCDVMKNFLICPAKFSYVCRKVFGKSGKIFFGMSGKKF
jgi:hypothetical protein